MDVLPGQHGRHMELADILREFATMNARELVLEGGASYELCFGTQAQGDSGRPVAAARRFIPPRSLVHVGRKCFQIVPENPEEGGSRSQDNFRNAERIVHFLPPRNWSKCLAEVAQPSL